LPKYVGKTVRLTGKNQAVNGTQLILQTFDGSSVMVILTNTESQINTAYLEVIGVVQPDYSIREDLTISIGDSVGMFSEFLIEIVFFSWNFVDFLMSCLYFFETLLI
jgi:hypothetical protein